MPRLRYRLRYTMKPKSYRPKPRFRAPSPPSPPPSPSPPRVMPRPTPPISPPDTISSASSSSSPPACQRASVSPKKGRPRRPSPQRSLPIFQCFICALFTGSRDEFLQHLQNATHRRLEQQQVKIQCNGGGIGGGRCLLRRSGVAHLVEHLTKVDFHFTGAESPACILTYGPMGNLITDDEETPGDGMPAGGGPAGSAQ